MMMVNTGLNSFYGPTSVYLILLPNIEFLPKPIQLKLTNPQIHYSYEAYCQYTVETQFCKSFFFALTTFRGTNHLYKCAEVINVVTFPCLVCYQVRLVYNY
jgi:hypothetical protein